MEGTIEKSQSVDEIAKLFGNFDLSTQEGMEKAVMHLSSLSWEELVEMLKALKITKEEDEKLRELKKETMKIHDQIRYIKQLLLEYKEEELKKIKETELYKKLLVFLDELEHKYLVLVEKVTSEKRKDNVKVLVIIKAMLKKAKGTEINKFKKD